MTEKEKRLYALIVEIRRAFHRLKDLADRLHRDLGVSPSMRAVLESLNRDGGRTVPEIAKEKGVSRQHIQTVMNGLADEGLVQAMDNPAHRRSPLFDLTPTGRETFQTIQARERTPLTELAKAFPDAQLKEAEDTVATLNREVDRMLKELGQDGPQQPESAGPDGTEDEGAVS